MKKTFRADLALMIASFVGGFFAILCAVIGLVFTASLSAGGATTLCSFILWLGLALIVFASKSDCFFPRGRHEDKNGKIITLVLTACSVLVAILSFIWGSICEEYIFMGGAIVLPLLVFFSTVTSAVFGGIILVKETLNKKSKDNTNE